MYKLKYQNVEKVVSTEIEKNKLIQGGYTLYDEKETEKEPEDTQEEAEEESIEDTQDNTTQEIQNKEQTEDDTQTKKGRGRNAK